MPAAVVDVTATNFAAEVVERSQTTPVLLEAEKVRVWFPIRYCIAWKTGEAWGFTATLSSGRRAEK